MKIVLVLRLQYDQVPSVIEVIYFNSTRPHFHSNVLGCSSTPFCTLFNLKLVYQYPVSSPTG